MEESSTRQSLAGVSQRFPTPVEIVGENPPPRVLSGAREEISLGCHGNHSPSLQLSRRNGFYNIRLQASQARKKNPAIHAVAQILQSVMRRQVKILGVLHYVTYSR